MWESTAALLHYGWTVSVCRTAAHILHKALDWLTNTGLHFQPNPCQFTRTDHASVFFSWSPKDALLSDFFIGFIPTLAMKWAFSFTLVTLGQHCLVRSAYPVPPRTHLTYPWLPRMLTNVMEEPGLPMEESVGTQGLDKPVLQPMLPGATSLVLHNLGVWPHLKHPSCRPCSHSTWI